MTVLPFAAEAPPRRAAAAPGPGGVDGATSGRFTLWCLELAGALFAHDEPEPAAFVLGVAASLRTAMGGPAIGQAEARRVAVAAQQALGAERFEAAWRAGHDRTLDTAVASGFRYPAVDRPVYEPELTRREEEILTLLARGYTDPVIARELSISVRTVHNHVAHIFDKLGVRTRTAAARAFLSRGTAPG